MEIDHRLVESALVAVELPAEIRLTLDARFRQFGRDTDAVEEAAVVETSQSNVLVRLFGGVEGLKLLVEERPPIAERDHRVRIEDAGVAGRERQVVVPPEDRAADRIDVDDPLVPRALLQHAELERRTQPISDRKPEFLRVHHLRGPVVCESDRTASSRHALSPSSCLSGCSVSSTSFGTARLFTRYTCRSRFMCTVT